MLTYADMLMRLREHADDGYRDFHSRLLKNDSICVLGVRMPALRAFAKEWKSEWRDILTFPDEFYEVTFLKCAVVGLLEFDEFCRQVDGVVRLIDNWATCDCFAAPCIKKHRAEFLPFIEKYLTDEGEFVKRYALVTLLHDYVDAEYLPFIFASVRKCKGEQYYEMMAAAWLVAEVLVKFYNEGMRFLNEKCMPAQMHNRAIRKACESYRLSPEQKNELKNLRR